MLHCIPHQYSNDSNNGSGSEEDVFANRTRSQNEVINRCNFTTDHGIDARLDTTKSLLSNDNPTNPLQQNDVNSDFCESVDINKKTYPAMLKLISGTLVGESKYAEVYTKLSSNDNEPPTPGHATQLPVPTLQGIARKVASIENKVLDEKQYLTYEIICCTFMMGLINDGCDTSTSLGSYLGQTLAGSDMLNKQQLIQELEARGGTPQLLMFLTGAAGCGKSSAVKVRMGTMYFVTR